MTVAIIMIITVSNTIEFTITISSTITSPIAIITGQQRIQQQTKTLVTIFTITIQQHNISNRFSQTNSSNITIIMNRLRIVILILNEFTQAILLNRRWYTPFLQHFFAFDLEPKHCCIQFYLKFK